MSERRVIKCDECGAENRWQVTILTDVEGDRVELECSDCRNTAVIDVKHPELTVYS